MPGSPAAASVANHGTANPMASNQPIVQAAEAIETIETVTSEPLPQGQASPAVPAKKKSSGKMTATILAIVFLLIAVGTAVAAILILKPFSKQDAVPAAMTKLMKGAPDYVMANGTVKIATEDDDATPGLNVMFTAGLDNKNRQNYVDAVVTAGVGMTEDFTFNVNEVHTSGGNLYLKLGGVAAALEQYSNMLESAGCTTDDVTGETVCAGDNDVEIEDMLGTNCVEDASGLTNCGATGSSGVSVLGALGLFEVIDDEWIMIPDSTFDSVSDIANVDSTTQCLIDAAGDLGKYGKDFVKLYEANPFITYSTENISVAKKKDTIYRLGFNSQKLAGFINATGNSGFMNELNACMGGTAMNISVSASDLTAIIAEIPAIYVEIDDNDNFTRVYFTADSEDASATVTVDISFSYPASITVTEPSSYIELNTLLSQVLGGFYGTEIVQEW